MFSDGRLYPDPYSPREPEEGGLYAGRFPPEPEGDANEPRPALPPPLPIAREFAPPELGGVNVCQPGREDVTDVEPRFAPKFCAGRAVLVGREVELTAPRPENPFDAALARVPLKKCCEAEGALR
jgi:hypothetical protein